MAVFQYKARNGSGQTVTGRIEGASADAVAGQLFSNGITPIDIKAAGAGVGSFAQLRQHLQEGKVQFTDLILFCRQMYTLLKAGVPIMQALRGLQDSTKSPALSRVIGEIHEGLDSGQDLSTAMARHTDAFPSLFVNLIQVGETTGQLQETFLQLALYLEREKDTRDRIKSAMRYPTIVIAAITIAMFIINIFVIPTFAKIYDGFNTDLPWATRVLMSTSEFFVNYWPLLLVGIIGAIFGFRSYIRTKDGELWWHKAKLKLPVIGGVLYRATLGRFARSLATSMEAGIPLVQAMNVVSRAVDNEYIGVKIRGMREGVERGDTITRTATATGMFPPMVLQMISVGEESGSIDTLMYDVADYYEREVEYDLKNLSSAIEPILIVAIGALVLILALGVFLPMWDMGATVMGK